MRRLRHIKSNRCYHLISRVAHRAFFLTESERTLFVERLWRVAKFSGIDVLAYCVMTNHFHILIYVPEPKTISDEELFNQLRAFYSGEKMQEISKIWNELVRLDAKEAMNRFRKQYIRRMWNVSEFMKTLKQNSTVSYNARKLHVGTMWEGRFKMQMVDPDEKPTLMNMAGYIDRNPLKAKLVSWPNEYEWCSFAAACKGDERCIDGYRFIYSFGISDWSKIQEMHEQSIHLAYKKLEEEKPLVSTSVEKQQKAEQRINVDVLDKIPKGIPMLLERGSNKVAFDLLRLLASREYTHAELREALGISSLNYFTARYIKPLLEKRLIMIYNGASCFSRTKTFRVTREGKELLDLYS